MSLPLTSSYSAESIFKAPDFIENVGAVVNNNIEGSFLEEAIFRNAGKLSQTISYRENANAPYLMDEPEIVAEGAEIPLSHIMFGDEKTSKAVKIATGITFSYEQFMENQQGTVENALRAGSNSFVRKSSILTAKKLKEADTNTVAASKSWEDGTANPLKDIREAKRIVANASANGRPEALYGYSPDTLIISESALEQALTNSALQDIYRGNIASENPLYTGATGGTLAGLNIFTSKFIAEGDIYVLDSSSAGFYGDTIPLTFSEVYAESSLGGSNMTYRTDLVRSRHIVIDNPKAITRITGALD